MPSRHQCNLAVVVSIVVSIVLCIVLSAPSSGFAATLLVDPAASGGANGVHATIQAALDAAREGDVVVVRPGEYVIRAPLEFNRYHPDAAKPAKDLTLRAEAGRESTVIRMGEPLDPNRANLLVFDDGESRASVVEGFTITGGRGLLEDEVQGGGVFCINGSSPTIRDCAIVENRATNGGSLFVRESSPLLVDCDLSHNLVRCGGGAYCVGGTPELVRCTIEGNLGSYRSSGVHAKAGAAPRLEACRIVGNETAYGGAADAVGAYLTFVNCVLAGNGADSGGAVYLSDSALVMVNTTIVSNRAREGGDLAIFRSTAKITNCIFWKNEPPGELPPAIDHSLVHADPGFVDPGRFDPGRVAIRWPGGRSEELPDRIVERPDYHLRPDSRAVDAGVGPALGREVPAVDIEGAVRPCGAAPDLGAYEAGACGLGAPYRRGLVDADGSVTISDAVSILLWLFASGSPPACRDAADIDDSGKIDLADPVRLLGWLFLAGPEPAPPFATCGPSPASSHDLGCVESPPTCPPDGGGGERGQLELE